MRYVIKNNELYWARTSKEWVNYKEDCTIYDSREECYRDLGWLTDHPNYGDDRARIVKLAAKAQKVIPGTAYRWFSHPETIYLSIAKTYDMNQDLANSEVIWCNNSGQIGVYGPAKKFWEEVKLNKIEILFCPKRDNSSELLEYLD
jgi:hypothetical protein